MGLVARLSSLFRRETIETRLEYIPISPTRMMIISYDTKTGQEYRQVCRIVPTLDPNRKYDFNN